MDLTTVMLDRRPDRDFRRIGEKISVVSTTIYLSMEFIICGNQRRIGNTLATCTVDLEQIGASFTGGISISLFKM